MSLFLLRSGFCLVGRRTSHSPKKIHDVFLYFDCTRGCARSSSQGDSSSSLCPCSRPIVRRSAAQGRAVVGWGKAPLPSCGLHPSACLPPFDAKCPLEAASAPVPSPLAWFCPEVARWRIGANVTLGVEGNMPLCHRPTPIHHPIMCAAVGRWFSITSTG